MTKLSGSAHEHVSDLVIRHQSIAPNISYHTVNPVHCPVQSNWAPPSLIGVFAVQVKNR